MRRHLTLICIGFFALVCLAGGLAISQRVQKDALELRLCRTAQQLSGEYGSFREHLRQIPDDMILAKLMDQEVFLPRSREYRVLVNSLRQEAPEKFPEESGLAMAEPALDSEQLAKQMQAWEREVQNHYRCPEPLVPEKYFGKFIATQPRVSFAAPAWDAVFAPALKRNAEIAAQYHEYVRRDTKILCRSRDGLAKARVIHEYLGKRCANAKGYKAVSLKCEAPMRRWEQVVGELTAVVSLNEAKFKEKWSKWLISNPIECARRT